MIQPLLESEEQSAIANGTFKNLLNALMISVFSLLLTVSFLSYALELAFIFIGQSILTQDSISFYVV
mgnify:FL=1|jgi:hypothetical protein